MGLYDKVTFEDGLDLRVADIGCELYEVTWQSKTINPLKPMLENYKITASGHLFKEEVRYEPVPEEERPGYDEGVGGFENECEKARGSIKKIHQGWSDTEYHGSFEVHTSIDGEYFSLELKFTDGLLVEISRQEVKQRDGDEWDE